MGFGDRFWTPTTARAILSWRIAASASPSASRRHSWGSRSWRRSPSGVVVYAGAVLFAMPRRPAHAGDRPVQRQRAVAPLRAGRPAIQAPARRDGPVHAARPAARPPRRHRRRGSTRGCATAWAVAKRGDEIDAAIAALDPTRLRSRLDTLRAQAATAPTEQTTAAVAAVERQLASADRLKQLSASTADQLRLTQARLDELVARAAEVSVGAADTERFATQVDELVLELESLHQAVQELPS